MGNKISKIAEYQTPTLGKEEACGAMRLAEQPRRFQISPVGVDLLWEKRETTSLVCFRGKIKVQMTRIRSATLKNCIISILRSPSDRCQNKYTTNAFRYSINLGSKTMVKSKIYFSTASCTYFCISIVCLSLLYSRSDILRRNSIYIQILN